MENGAPEHIKTDCLWPSFDEVEVVVTPDGAGFRISDAGGAARSAYVHGQEGDHVEAALAHAALRYGVELEDDLSLTAFAVGPEWKRSAILAVANASARAAHNAIGG